MSWLQPAQSDYDFVDKLQADQDCYSLLQIAALLPRIEPTFLRNARLEYAPASDVELEADIWFHSVIHSRNPRAVVMRGGVARVLAEKLVQDEDAFNKAQKFVIKYMQHWPAKDRLEQQLRIHALTGNDQALQYGLHRIIKTLAKSENPQQRKELARWAKGALPSLLSQNSDEATQWLNAYLAALLGSSGWRHENIQDAHAAGFPPWLSQTLVQTNPQPIDLLLRPGVLQCLPAGQGEHTISIASPLPTLVKISTEPGNYQAWHSLFPGGNVFFEHEFQRLTLQTLSGHRYRLSVEESTEEELRDKTREQLVSKLRLVYVPEDAEQANTIKRLLEKQNIEVELVEDQFHPEIDSGEQVLPVLRLWTPIALEYWHQHKLSLSETRINKSLLLTTDGSLPLPSGFNETQVLNFNQSIRDSQSSHTNKLSLDILDWLNGKVRTDEIHQQQEGEDADLQNNKNERIKLFVGGFSRDNSDIRLFNEIHRRFSSSNLKLLNGLSSIYRLDQSLELAQWSAECNVALLIVTESALRYPYWLEKQTRLLLWRKMVQPEFQVIIVPWGGVSVREFSRQHYLQQLTYGSQDRTSVFEMKQPISTTDLILQVNRRLMTARNPSVFKQMEFSVSRILKTLEQNNIQDIWNAIKPNENLDEINLTAEKLAGTITKKLFANPDDAWTYLKTLLSGFHKDLVSGHVLDFIELMKSIWVSPLVAEPIVEEGEKIYQELVQLFGNRDEDVLQQLLDELDDPNTTPPRRLEIGDILNSMQGGDPRPGVGVKDIEIIEYPPEIQVLLDELNDINTPPPRRLEIGDQLAEMSDPRPGVGLDESGFPDIDWVEIPAGPFIYGEGKEQQTLELGRFFISRYPITNLQYQAFIDDGGYEDERCWRGLNKPRPIESEWLQLNRPRTDVDWYEAFAFCYWLSLRLGYEISLPIEQQWEKAARGVDGRVFPWGSEYVNGYANINEKTNGGGYLNQSCAVGLYPQGNSPYGVADMSGNVDEWCIDYYDFSKDSEVKGNDMFRVIRGGSWIGNIRNATLSHRIGIEIEERHNPLGFRLVRVCQ